MAQDESKKEEKKNPWWEYVEEKEGETPPQPEKTDETPPPQPQDQPIEEITSHTPPTIKMPGQAAGTEPTLVGGFAATPPPSSIGSPTEMPPTTQPYAPPPQPGAPSAQAPQFTPTGAPPGAPPPSGQVPFPAQPTEPLPVMPGTMPTMGPGDMAQYQKLQLTDLGPGAPYATEGANLSLLLDVPVPLTVVAGRTTMRIQEILGLQHGSVIPLDRNVDEPVDLLIKDKLIAQGELVVIDEKYFGIKITKIVEPEQRVKDIG